MIILIEVKCPHCGAGGQVILPPIGSLIIGPCPECHGLVIIFLGQALGLDNAVMLNGKFRDKKNHVIQVLFNFIRERIDGLIEDWGKSEAASELKPALNPITTEEVRRFTRQELNLLDGSQESFDALFDSGGNELPPDASRA